MLLIAVCNGLLPQFYSEYIVLPFSATTAGCLYVVVVLVGDFGDTVVYFVSDFDIVPVNGDAVETVHVVIDLFVICA